MHNVENHTLSVIVAQQCTILRTLQSTTPGEPCVTYGLREPHEGRNHLTPAVASPPAVEVWPHHHQSMFTLEDRSYHARDVSRWVRASSARPTFLKQRATGASEPVKGG